MSKDVLQLGRNGIFMGWEGELIYHQNFFHKKSMWHAQWDDRLWKNNASKTGGGIRAQCRISIKKSPSKRHP